MGLPLLNKFLEVGFLAGGDNDGDSLRVFAEEGFHILYSGLEVECLELSRHGKYNKLQIKSWEIAGEFSGFKSFWSGLLKEF